MHKNIGTKTTRNGFTLVELSIAIVVVGLLIGGILVGQSLIESAKMKKTISFLQQADIAYAKFKAKFKYPPGDSPFHNAPGNGDGFVYNATDHLTRHFNSEVANFWRHLQQDGFMESHSTWSNIATNGARANIHMPEIPIGNPKTGIVVYYHIPSKTQAYLLANFDVSTTDCIYTTSCGGNPAVKNIHVKEAKALELKLDDGYSNTGNITADTGCNGSGAGGGRYNYNSDLDKLCYLYINFFGIQY